MTLSSEEEFRRNFEQIFGSDSPNTSKNKERHDYDYIDNQWAYVISTGLTHASLTNAKRQ